MKKSSSVMPVKNQFLLCLLLFGIAGKAQTIPSDSSLTRLFQTDVLLPLLIDSAMKNSPAIRHNAKSVALFEQNQQTAKKSLLNSVSLTSSYGYGNTGSIAYEKDLSGLGQGNFFSNIRSSRYNIGVALQLPLGSFLSRKNTARAAELQTGMAEEEKAGTELFVKQEVIRLYQELKLAHALLLTSTRMKQSSFISITMAQKNFMDGQIPVDQLSNLQNTYNNAQMECERHINKFQTSFLILEAYTGVQLTRLINRLR